MKRLIALALLVAVAGGAATVPSAPAAAQEAYVTADPPSGWSAFYGPLSPYGRWFVYSPYGWVWTPTVVSPDWRPYTIGHWVWTDYGWAFMSDEPWGWATSHYGRWFYDGEFGWIWVPDTVWGPAWVCWRHSDLFFGWAPLPPGFVFGVSLGSCDPWVYGWSFVDYDYFLAPDVVVYVLPPARNPWIIDHTQPELTTTTFHEPPKGSRGPATVIVPRGPDPKIVSDRLGTLPRRTINQIQARHPSPAFREALPPSRIEPQPGARNLDRAPVGGQHRPETTQPNPSKAVREIPSDRRGPRVPTAPVRPAPAPRPAAPKAPPPVKPAPAPQKPPKR